jgi:acyl carrier protein
LATIELACPLRYTGTSGQGNAGGIALRARSPVRLSRQKLRSSESTMSTTFDTVANIIAETCDIPRADIKPESHAIKDLEIDSLDFLDVAFAIDKAFAIKLPLERWTQEVNDGKVSGEEYFVLKNLSTRIDDLVAGKEA